MHIVFTQKLTDFTLVNPLSHVIVKILPGFCPYFLKFPFSSPSIAPSHTHDVRRMTMSSFPSSSPPSSSALTTTLDPKIRAELLGERTRLEESEIEV